MLFPLFGVPLLSTPRGEIKYVLQGLVKCYPTYQAFANPSVPNHSSVFSHRPPYTSKLQYLSSSLKIHNSLSICLQYHHLLLLVV